VTERRMWFAALFALVGFVGIMIIVGNMGAARQGVHPLTVSELLAEDEPAERWGSEELAIVGWYAELDADCEGDEGGADDSVAWLQRDCPLRVLLGDQPSTGVTQADLEASGVRLAAPLGNRFPSRAKPGGPNLRGVQLVFEGHFDDERSAGCVPERLARCRNTFVVTDYDELVR
jgi:hypothetical protein